MPRKYSLKFGGNPVMVPQESSNGFMIGLAIFFIFLLAGLSGLIGYYGFIRETCKDKEDDEFKITCPAGKKLKNKVCENDCDEIECCEEKTCNPPSSLPTGYSGSPSLETLKSVSDFQDGVHQLSGVTCNTPEYKGTPVARTCSAGATWVYDGCERTCKRGPNPDAPGITLSDDRQSGGSCSDHDPSNTDGQNDQRKFCNGFYNSNGNFCKLQVTDLISLDPTNNCVEGSSCAV